MDCDASTEVGSQESSSSSSTCSDATIIEVPQPRFWSRVPASALLRRKDKIPDIAYDKTTLSKIIHGEVHNHTTASVRSTPWTRPSPARYAPWTRPALTPYTGALVLSYYMTSEAVTIYLRNGAFFTISLDPPKTALSQALGPELTILSADADHQCPYTTRQLLNIIDVLSYVHSTTFRSITLSSSPPVTWTDEAVYSLNLIAALTCRLLAYPYHKFVQLQSLVEHYKDVIRERLPFELGLASPTVTKAFVDGDVWPKDVLVELGIVEENLGDEMKAYECEMED